MDPPSGAGTVQAFCAADALGMPVRRKRTSANAIGTARGPAHSRANEDRGISWISLFTSSLRSNLVNAARRRPIRPENRNARRTNFVGFIPPPYSFDFSSDDH